MKTAWEDPAETDVVKDIKAMQKAMAKSFRHSKFSHGLRLGDTYYACFGNHLAAPFMTVWEKNQIIINMIFKDDMRDQIRESVNRMSKKDCKDVATTFKLKSQTKLEILKAALEDEDVAEYVLMY